MVRKYISNDIDPVQPTQYPPSKSRVAKSHIYEAFGFWQNDWPPVYAASWLVRTEHSSEDAFINARDIRSTRAYYLPILLIPLGP